MAHAVSTMIVSRSQSAFVSVEQFIEGVTATWPDARILRTSRGDYTSSVTDVTARIREDDGPGFQVMREKRGQSVFTDGTRAQAARVAAWVAPLGDDLLLVDVQAEVCVWLRAGMTPEEIEAAWHEPLPTE